MIEIAPVAGAPESERRGDEASCREHRGHSKGLWLLKSPKEALRDVEVYRKAKNVDTGRRW